MSANDKQILTKSYESPQNLIWTNRDYTNFINCINWPNLTIYLAEIGKISGNKKVQYNAIKDHIKDDPSLEAWFKDFRIRGCLVYPKIFANETKYKPFSHLISIFVQQQFGLSEAIEETIKSGLEKNFAKTNGNKTQSNVPPTPPQPQQVPPFTQPQQPVFPNPSFNNEHTQSNEFIDNSVSLNALGTFDFSLYQLLLQKKLIGEETPLQNLSETAFKSTRPLKKHINYPDSISVPVIDYSYKKLKMSTLTPYPEVLNRWIDWIQQNSQTLKNLNDSEFRTQVMEFIRISINLKIDEEVPIDD